LVGAGLVVIDSWAVVFVFTTGVVVVLVFEAALDCCPCICFDIVFVALLVHPPIVPRGRPSLA
jgi:hypothetical protein